MIPICAALVSMMSGVQGVIEPGSEQKLLMTISMKPQISATSCSPSEVAECGSLCWQAEYADDNMIPICPDIPGEHDVMGAGGDRAWQWAGGADDHLDQWRNQRHRPASCSQTGMPALPSVMIPWRDKTCPTGG